MMSERDVIEQASPAQDQQTTAPAVPPETVPLADVLRQIRRDAASEPGKYLQETEMPYGGE